MAGALSHTNQCTNIDNNSENDKRQKITNSTLFHNKILKNTLFSARFFFGRCCCCCCYLLPFVLCLQKNATAKNKNASKRSVFFFVLAKRNANCPCWNGRAQTKWTGGGLRLSACSRYDEHECEPNNTDWLTLGRCCSHVACPFFIQVYKYLCMTESWWC